MPKDAFDTDVLIVGAGPVGLFLANECVVRPDGYIAFSELNGEGIAAIESARRLLELQTNADKLRVAHG